MSASSRASLELFFPSPYRSMVLQLTIVKPRSCENPTKWKSPACLLVDAVAKHLKMIRLPLGAGRIGCAFNEFLLHVT